MADVINHGNAYSEHINRANVVVRLLLFAFVIVCVFDPADRVLGAKVWLFVALWGATLIAGLLASDEIRLPVGLLVCVFLFIAIPLLSIVWYYVANGEQPYAGASIMMAIFLFPIARAFFATTDRRARAPTLGFLAYVCMCATNPMLLSSTGMLFFSMMLANTFQASDGHRYSSMRGQS
jgi:hypothetical protein